ncbi:unnamed protein product [Rotaria sordida]|uniref:Spermatogenesis-associated protein 1 C-terminal domain-containing protein n=1 Tax=Rotaria sordida TaxID=392033 RepID=A0A818T5P9_9BILA|nr:unnamed protein product [Rotaria sordida]CAF3682132.1 unnamed protein product [Rotaria sordida]
MQSQLESEHLTLRTNIISVDRPDSSQLVDLHVYIIPKHVWKNRQNLAENDTMEQAISAGFVHVPQNLTIHELRQYIHKICGQDDQFPKDFIYLRSVGRCLTKVKPQQETDLRVKNYRPPMTFAPEIFILEGHHDDESSTPTNTKSYLFRESPIHRSLMSPLPLTTSRQQSWSKPIAAPLLPPSTLTYRTFVHSSERKNSTNFNDLAVSSDSNLSTASSILSARELAKLREEQERLRLRQIELARQRHEIEQEQKRREKELLEKQKNLSQEQQQQHEIEQEQQKREKELLEKQKNLAQEQQHEIEQEQQKREKELLEKQKNLSREQRQKEEEQAAIRIQGAYRNYRNRRKLKEKKQQEHAANEIERLQKEARELARRKAEEEHIEELNAHDVVKLSNHLEELKTKRVALEAARETIIRQMQQLHAQIAVRRTEERDLWKQKYLIEKKKTAALEERGRITLNDQSDTNTELEQAKIRLNNSTKLRQQAENECHLLEEELKQIRLNMSNLENRSSSKQSSSVQQKQQIKPISLDITLQY